MPRLDLIQIRRDSAADWTATNPTLSQGEPGYETDTGRHKIGDGSTAWTDLEYAAVLQVDLDDVNDRTTPGVLEIVALGDSFTDGSESVTGDITTYGPTVSNVFTWPQRALPWLCALSGQRARVVHWAGIAGNTTTQMLARWDTDVAPHLTPGRWVVLSSPGINDEQAGHSVATNIANLTEIFARIKAAGCRVLTHTIPPSSNPSATTAQLTHRAAVNYWLRGQGFKTPGVHVADVHAAMSDGTAADDWQNQGQISPFELTIDGIHTAMRGAARMGWLLFKEIERFLPRLRPNGFGSGDAPGLVITNRNICLNPSFTGTGGTTANGITGTLPTSWRAVTTTGAAAAGTSVCSIVPATDASAPYAGTPEAWMRGGDDGKWICVENTVTASRVEVQQTINTAAGVIVSNYVGQEISFTIEAVLENVAPAAGTTGTAFGVSLLALNASSQQVQATDMGLPPGGVETWPVELEDADGRIFLTLRTPPFVLPAGTTALILKVPFYSTGKLWLRDPEVRLEPSF